MMRLHSIEIHNVRGVEHLRVDELPETGVVVIHGENEAGKSTIVEAIDTVLTEKHSGASKKIKALKPVHRDASPEVRLEATVGPYRFRIHKRWLKKKISELHVLEPRPAQFTGGAADDELDRILSEHLDRQLLDALFLRQDDLGSGVAAVGIPSVTSALESASGMDTAVAEDSELITRVQKEYEKYFTARTGAPAKEYKDAQTRVSEAESVQQDAEQALRQLDDVVIKYEAAQQAKAEAEQALPAAETELAQRETEVAEAKAALEKIEAQKAELSRAEAELETAREAVERRRAMAQDVASAAEAVEALAAKVEEFKLSTAQEEEVREQLAGKLAEAQKSYEAARKQLQLARRYHEKKQWEALRQRLAGLKELDAELKRRRSQLAEAPEVGDLRALEQATTEVTVQERVHAAAAAKFVFSGEGAFVVDGEERTVPSADASDDTVQLRDGMAFEFGALRATYQAGAGEASEDTLQHVRARLAELLDAAGCESVEEARAKNDEYQRLRSAVEQAQRELKAALGADDLGELEARYAAQADSFEGVAELEEQGEQDQVSLVDAEAAEEAARVAVTGAEKELAPYRESSTAAVLAGAQARHEAAVEHHDSADAALQKAREVATDAALDSAVAAAEEKLTRQRGVLAELSAVDVDTVFALYEGVKEEVRSLHNTVHDADGDMREYSGRIEMHSGVAERLESANAELEIAREVLAAVEKRANAARYLRELLLTHRDAARQRYAQPFVTKLNGLARKVFGGDVDFELSEELVVTARSRDGQTVDLGSLSGGAKEQMAILTRFAIAGLVQDDGVPVIVDDALGSTDSTRLNLMSTLFAQVAKHSQVLVLTCMPQRYARVPSRLELDIEALKG
ncbi:AAA family ATPase [Corynebacterium striatum]|uniref:AAA family ATPase n=1 Tax=Corynebacterium striatum TaxID=43770 RepID=UPI001A2991FE|nr:AAA family ATPase [Corynebacterium striatum]HAT1252717.1 AAA family ATPase [Corynebacterium striatum]HAT1265855.1 AAA family ATPase [Corynebacterium striatum]HAT1294641.1 AAA family ATPase [Corynebacterium striatum]HAT1304591.1 AAA family ATPase [Corynebacterium striatum]